MKAIGNKISLHYVAIGIGILYALVICFRFFHTGYLWWLDYFFPPFGWIGPVGSNGFVVWLLSVITKHIISAQVLEKLMLVCAFFVPFVWWVYMLKKSKSIRAMIFAGLCMTCNPYFYDRFMDGQLGMYLLFCVIPFWLISLYAFFAAEKKNIYHYLVPTLLSLLTTSISMHGAWFVFVSFVVFFLVFLKHRQLVSFFKQGIALGFGILVVNLYWIVPNIIDTDGAQQRIDTFGSQDLRVFENYTGKANNYITTLSLQWYRWEWYDRFVPSYGGQKYPFVIFGLLFGIVLLGIVYKLREAHEDEKKFSWCILILLIIGYVLGLGTAGDTIFAPLTTFFYHYVPFYPAMRESHKWVLFMVIGYAYFGAYGAYFLWKIFHRTTYHHVIISLTTIIVLIWYTPSIFFVSKQLPVLDYPPERYALRTQLLEAQTWDNACSTNCYDMLVLPWHQYMRLSFVERNVLNPAAKFFSPLGVLQGDNIEIWPLYSQSNDPVSRTIVSYLRTQGIVNDTGNTTTDIIENAEFVDYLKSIHVDYILLLKEVDYKVYETLMTTMTDSKLLEKYIDNNYFVVYVIK